MKRLLINTAIAFTTALAIYYMVPGAKQATDKALEGTIIWRN